MAPRIDHTVRKVLERELPRRVARYVNVDRCARYVVERAEVELGLRQALSVTAVAARQVKPAERPIVDSYVRRGLLAGGWPGHLQALVDRLEA